MKRAAPDPVRARLFQRHKLLHDADDVRLASEVVDESLRETHQSVPELGDHFNFADEVLVELLKFVSWYPILLMLCASNDLYLVTIDKTLSYTKPGYIT